MPPPPPWLLLLLARALLGAAQEPQAAACGPDGCYALYPQRRSFLEAWRSCREQGGNLATLKHPEEAEQVAELLREAGAGGQQPPPPPSQPLFWIGLQRQPRQCFPQRPLRGFTWTTGDQDSVYTNWARPAAAGGSSGSCAAARCVVLGGHDALWHEGSCSLPVDGYLCRFAFQGMCPGLQEEEEEEEGGSVSYSTPFGPAGGRLRYVPFGTVAAVSCGGGASAAAVSVLCLQKEDGAVGWSKSAPLCREAAYPQHSWCEGDNGGCQQLCLDEEDAGYSCECHAGYYLLPDGHSCAAGGEGACRGQPCQFECVPEADGGYRCRCPEGYELLGDGRHCEDVDECAQAPCEHQCENTEGSFVCRCHLGFSLSDGEEEEDEEEEEEGGEGPGRCTDTDECQIAGVCQQMCVNYVGGFECYCSEGYELDADGITCLLVAQFPPPPATARSPPGGGGGGDLLLPPFEWPQDMGGHLDHSLALSEPFPAFPEPLPSARATQAPRAPPSAAPSPDPSSDPPHRSSTPNLRSPTLSPTLADSSPPPLAPAAPGVSTRGPPPTPTDPRSSPPLSAPTASPPLHSPVRAGSPGREGEEDAVVGGVRAWATPSATPGEEEEEPARPRRDNRWLLLALLVPICVFVVVMLALGLVYCTRCGAQAKTRSVTQCYRWVISSAGKGGPPPASSPCQPRGATRRTSV
ncbi:endosialin [Hemicordylus capensis]|uniref:endosialin n=1 Tax=Hemicordylus capensis TaxID=884348 RepID=UPI002303103B|nr:endosialin [Hemicordylus capensis]